MSSYLGRLVDRAVGPPASAVSPRLAPVFPLARAARHEPEPLPLQAGSVPQARVETERPPAVQADARAKDVTASSAVTELREVHVERPAHDRREPAEPVEARVDGPPRTEIRTHERTRETVRREVEPARQAKAPGAVTSRLARDPLPPARRSPTPQSQPPRIEVQIGRVEVRREPRPDPFDWHAPAAEPAAAAPFSGFGELAASRRYVDRRWS